MRVPIANPPDRLPPPPTPPPGGGGSDQTLPLSEGEVEGVGAKIVVYAKDLQQQDHETEASRITQSHA